MSNKNKMPVEIFTELGKKHERTSEEQFEFMKKELLKKKGMK